MNDGRKTSGRLPGLLLALMAVGCGQSTAPAPAGKAANVPAVCADFAPDPFVTRNELASGRRAIDATMLLRFWHYTDDHVIDDDGQAINGLSALELVHPILDAAIRTPAPQRRCARLAEPAAAAGRGVALAPPRPARLTLERA